MERFDLSYRTGGVGYESLIVEWLPFDPLDYETDWEAKREEPNCCEVALRFDLNTLPPGIPTWFIAREHRFSTNLHWRRGGLFQSRDGKHLGLIRADEHERSVHLEVREPYPGDFFALLRDGLDLTFDRYPGLRIDRVIPCPGHGDGPCNGEFLLDNILSRLEKQTPKTTIECPVAAENVDIAALLYGWHPATAMDPLAAQIGELRDEMRREFEIVAFREKSKIKTECPSLFVLEPSNRKAFLKTVVGHKVHLRLCCEAPGHQHPVVGEEPYEIDVKPEWLKEMAPYLRGGAKVLKFAAPFVLPGIGISAKDAAKDLGSIDIHASH